MIFVGDVSIYKNDKFTFSKFDDAMKSQPWCINLEGPINIENINLKTGLFNCQDFLKNFDDFNIKMAFLANNHIHDIKDGVTNSRDFLTEKNISSTGVISVDNEMGYLPLSIYEEFLILGYGWDVIGCDRKKDSYGNSIGIISNKILNDVKNLKKQVNQDYKIIILFHSSYELEAAPQPAHRSLSKKLIDLGVDSIIFHHSHIAGHIEIYKEKPIFYGIGNWAASRSKFLNQKLHYPEICNKQLAVEINNGFKVHVCEHKDHNKIEYIKTVSKENLKEFAAPFTNYSDKDYIKWYIKNRRQSFLLPFFSINDGKLMTFFKKFWIRLRQFMIAFLVFIRFKIPNPIDRS